jgi:hypothetical protein
LTHHSTHQIQVWFVCDIIASESHEVAAVLGLTRGTDVFLSAQYDQETLPEMPNKKLTITYEGKRNNTFTAKDLSAAIKQRVSTLDHDDATGVKILEYIRKNVVKPDFSAKLLGGVCNIGMDPATLGAKHCEGTYEVLLKVKGGGKVEQAAKVQIDVEPDPNVWPANVVCAKAKHDVPEPFQSKIIEIAGRGGGGSHGAVTFKSGGEYQHWIAGSTQRIFGTFASGTLTVAGWGVHGNTDSDYNVELAAGGKTTATTK